MHIFPTISFTLLPNSKLQSSSKSFTNTTTVQPHDQKTDKIHTPRVPYHGSQPYAFFTNDFKRAWPYDNHITRSLTVIACLSMLTCALGIAALLLVSENVRSKYLLPHKLVAMAATPITIYLALNLAIGRSDHVNESMCGVPMPTDTIFTWLMTFCTETTTGTYLFMARRFLFGRVDLAERLNTVTARRSEVYVFMLTQATAAGLFLAAMGLTKGLAGWKSWLVLFAWGVDLAYGVMACLFMVLPDLNACMDESESTLLARLAALEREKTAEKSEYDWKPGPGELR